MEFLGAYYLHKNGSLIWKNAIVFNNNPGYFDSPFVKAVFYIPKNSPTGNKDGDVLWFVNWLIKAFKLGANKQDIIRICKANNLSQAEWKIIFNESENI